MTDAAMNAKLDRILAGVTIQAERLSALEQSQNTTNAALLVQDETLRTIVELLTVINERLSKPGSIDVVETLLGILRTLKQIEADGERMVTTMFRIPGEIGKAVHDAIRLERGEGIDPP